MTSPRNRTRLVESLRKAGIADERVLGAINRVPRHSFLDEAMASYAYNDQALPIGHGQTISQPFVVARMTEALLTDGELRHVLEVGTGSGYQCAVLAELVPEVYSVERIKVLYSRARNILNELGYQRVRLAHLDGSEGWPQYAPYDAILVTARAETVPETLCEQLAPGGRLIMPVGTQGRQELHLLRREGQGYETENLGGVSFVPLLGNKS
jgi:protein-L-isoaspartate(D-aspartate) O-methyltransferase